MFFKNLLICAQALLIQTISAQCIGSCGAYNGLGCDGFGYGPASLAASHGPGLAVTSISPIYPVGVSILSENGYEGILSLEGALPFLGTITIEGGLPTIGAGTIAYGCGNGAVRISAEDGVSYGYGGTGPFGYGIAGPFGFGVGDRFGFGYALARRRGYRSGCGRGGFY